MIVFVQITLLRQSHINTPQFTKLLVSPAGSMDGTDSESASSECQNSTLKDNGISKKEEVTAHDGLFSFSLSPKGETETVSNDVFASLQNSNERLSGMNEASEMINTEKDQIIGKKIKIIVGAFRSRTQKVKSKIEQPPTPTEGLSETEEPGVEQQLILDDFADSIYASNSSIAMGKTFGERWKNIFRMAEYIDPRGTFNIGYNMNMFLALEYFKLSFDFENFTNFFDLTGFIFICI